MQPLKTPLKGTLKSNRPKNLKQPNPETLDPKPEQLDSLGPKPKTLKPLNP